MSLINLISALLILSVFMIGFSQILLSTGDFWERALKTYRIAETIHFISESFRIECAKPNRNMENWENAILTAKYLDYYQIIELKKDDELKALNLIFYMSGEKIEVLGSINP